jgi:hypothetical protein
MATQPEFLKHSYYPRDGYQLDVGRLWELDTGSHTMRDLEVFADSRGIRVRDMYCGEWEMAERSAVHLTPELARALGEILLEAAQQVEHNASIWKTHARWADPRPALAEALDEHLERSREDREALVEHGALCPDCIADADAIGEVP